jgi:membrane-associated phospholipid phosphatase
LIIRWRRALVTVAIAVLITGALGVRYAGDSHPAWLDRAALSVAREWFPMPRGSAMVIIGLYDPVPLVISIAVLAGVCLALSRRRLAVLAVAGPLLTGLATTVVKPVIERTKNGDLSYPSGHMGSAVAISVVVSLLLVSLLGARRWVTAVAVAVPILWGATVGLAMTVTNYHYWTDAVGGFCVAVAVVLSLALLIDWTQAHRDRIGSIASAGGRAGALRQSIFGRDAPAP